MDYSTTLVKALSKEEKEFILGRLREWHPPPAEKSAVALDLGLLEGLEIVARARGLDPK